MKTAGHLTGSMILLLLLLQPGTAAAAPRDPLTGCWEGTFMGDFRTVITFSSPALNQYSGNIQMFSGSQGIQDDPITDIVIREGTVTFRIPAKETSFTGGFNEEGTLLSGKFVFPDGSEHPLELARAGSIGGAPSSPEDLYSGYRAKQLEPEGMKEDLLALMESLRALHPQLNRYTPDDRFDQEVAELLQTLESPLGLEEYYMRIAPVTDLVHCSHTGIRLPARYRQLSMEYGQFLPLGVMCDGKCGYFLFAAGNPRPDLPPGARIISVNGIPFGKIIESLLPLVASEGNNTSTKYHQLNRHFQWYYHFLDPSPTFRVEFQTATANILLTFDACSLNDIDPGLSRPVMEVVPAFRLMEDGATGILQISSFEIRDMEGYMARLDSIFKLLRQQEVLHLILDLRGNHGGHPIFAAQLLSHLVDEDFTYFRSNPDMAEFEPLYHPMHPSGDGFHGNLYVLVDGGCLSTTGHLISLIKYHTQAIFLGEEPGSSYSCNDFSQRITLPNSGIEVNIPRTTFETAVRGFDNASPFPLDHHIAMDPMEMIRGTDRCMQFCLEMISKL